MRVWAWQTQTSVLLGLALFLATLIPVLIFQYRRYGGISIARFSGAAAVAVYSVALLVFTMLPLPSITEQWCLAHPRPFQSVPFHFLSDLREARSADAGLSWGELLRSFTFLQVAFNVLLFVPLGLILRGFAKLPALLTIVVGCAVSVLIEFTQYTGIWGLFPCAYRQGDIDDIITNTLGTVIGVLFAPLVLRWMPSSAQLERSRYRPRPVTVWRRWFGMLLDWIFLQALAFTFSIVLALFTNFGQYFAALTGDLRQEGRAGISDTPLPGIELWQVSLAYLLAALIVFYFPALRGAGSSLGKRTVWLKSQWRTQGLKESGLADQPDGAAHVGGAAEQGVAPEGRRAPASVVNNGVNNVVDHGGVLEGSVPASQAGVDASGWHDGTLGERLARATVSGGIYAALEMGSRMITVSAAERSTVVQGASEGNGLGAIVTILGLILVVSIPFTKTKRGLSGVLTRSRLTDSR